jgi:flagellar basal-body rod protein FlgG
MSPSLFHTLNISRQDMVNRLLDLDVTASNLANVNTSGYKSQRTNFQEMVNNASASLQGISVSGTQMLTTQGTLKSSTSALDWAIQGEGLFAVTLPDGQTGYTRSGQFYLDSENNLVTASGYPLVWDGAIPDNMSDLAISQDGTVTALLTDGSTVTAGRVSLNVFANPTALSGQGSNVWLATDASGAAQSVQPGTGGSGWVTSHAVEQSNVDLSREMTNLVTLQRNFEMSVKAFQQTDSMISQAINMRKG